MSYPFFFYSTLYWLLAFLPFIHKNTASLIDLSEAVML